MNGIYYSFENTSSPRIHLLRFYQSMDVVIAKTLWTPRIDDLSKELKQFGYEGMDVIGPAEEVFVGGFLEGNGTISFKVENYVANSADSWARHDVLSFKGKVISENELQFKVTSKATKATVARTYFYVEGNEIVPQVDLPG